MDLKCGLERRRRQHKTQLDGDEWFVAYTLHVEATRSKLSLYHSCDSTTIRRYHDAFDYDGSDRNYDVRSIRLRYDYDTTTTKN